eukprot:5993974-Pyramimonas_sp.AAC.3
MDHCFPRHQSGLPEGVRNLLRLLLRRNAVRVLLCRLDRPQCSELPQGSNTTMSRSTACCA